MCDIMKEINSECIRQERYQIAMELIKIGLLSKEQIAKATHLTLNVIEELKAMGKSTA